jgi:hypothetical protein
VPAARLDAKDRIVLLHDRALIDLLARLPAAQELMPRQEIAAAEQRRLQSAAEFATLQKPTLPRERRPASRSAESVNLPPLPDRTSA